MIFNITNESTNTELNAKVEASLSGWNYYKTYEAERWPMRGQIGYIVTGGRHAKKSHGKGYIVYGPYTTKLVVGTQYKARFYVKVNNCNHIYPGEVDVYSLDGFKIEKSIISSNGYHEYDIDFTVPRNGMRMEYRVKAYGTADITVDKVVIFRR